MKWTVILATLLMTGLSFASELSFKCEFTDHTYMNQFSLEAKKVAFNEAGDFHHVEFDLSLRKAGRNQQVERLAVTRDGSVQIFPAGTMYTKPTARVASVVKGAEIEYINLLIDMPPLHSSQIRFANGLTYFGSCHSLIIFI